MMMKIKNGRKNIEETMLSLKIKLNKKNEDRSSNLK